MWNTNVFFLPLFLTFRTFMARIIFCWVFYRELQHSYFPYFTSEDMKKYVTREKRVFSHRIYDLC